MEKSLVEKFKLAGTIITAPLVTAFSAAAGFGAGVFGTFMGPVIALAGVAKSGFDAASGDWDGVKNGAYFALAAAGLTALAAGTAYVTKMDYAQSAMAVSAVIGGFGGLVYSGKGMVEQAQKVSEASNDPPPAP